jgi:chromosome segregation ATPase
LVPFFLELEIRKSMATLESGISAGDIVVQAFHEAVSVAQKHFRDCETTFLKDELLIRERLVLLDKVVSNAAEERRVLEVQLQDARTQSAVAKKKGNICSAEVQRVNNLLTQQLAELDAHEQRILSQQDAAKAKLEEVAAVAAALEERLSAAMESEKEIEDAERSLFHKERDYDTAKREMQMLEREVDEKRKSLERKESSITSWIRALDNRESDLTSFQQKFHEDLQRIEKQEQLRNPALAHAASLSQRAVMDDHGMTIDRDEEDDESLASDSD